MTDETKCWQAQICELSAALEERDREIKDLKKQLDEKLDTHMHVYHSEEMVARMMKGDR